MFFDLDRRLLALGACVVAGSIGCSAADEPGFVVSSDPSSDLLASVAYDDGALVEFRGNADDGVLVAALVPRGALDPVAGVRLGDVVPSALFESLTGAPAPAALRVAEGEGRVARVSDVPVLKGLPIAEDFARDHCYPRIEFCLLNQSGDQKLHSRGRVDGVDGAVAAGAGALRARIFSKKVGSDRLLATYGVSDAEVEIGAWTPGIDRDMRVEIDRADGVTYHVSADFHD
jgi:hypothetical protein